MSTLRFELLKEALGRTAVPVVSEGRPADDFEKLVFTRRKMQRYLSRTTYTALVDSIDRGQPLSRAIANGVATGMKQWAIDTGATHYTHWFQPLTGGTAEKHDAFLEPDPAGGVIEEFSGKLLVQQEPDASSLPSGGLRNTFEARGYSAWDPSSPAFVLGDTLCIPTVFIAYTGEALDYKTPLLRSVAALDRAATAVCRYFDEGVGRVIPRLGVEQEYFLVDDGLYAARHDLVMTGRTLMGHESARNQQLEDHYLGSIPTRVLAFMTDLENEALRLGIPVKTRHNEVAPNQFELAPVHEEMNLANDHNVLLMSLMKKVGRRHHFRVLLHEKPFKGVNGSGKHCNWSLATDTGVNLLAPGGDGAGNLRFMVFLVNTIAAVWRHNGLLKATVSSATNAHRLGAGEAPPAIVSVFTGRQISAVLGALEKADTDEVIHFDDKAALGLGIAHIPELLIDNTDRNRTSPFAFTGNRFEFRAVGASANSAESMLVLNTAVADELTRFRERVDELVAGGATREKAMVTVMKGLVAECRDILFEGNGYSDEWRVEAGRRGLDCEVSVPLIIDNYARPETIALFERVGVLSRSEVTSRCEVKREMYTKKIQIESRVLGDLAMNHIVPVASAYEGVLLDKIAKIDALFPADEAAAMSRQDRRIVREIGGHIDFITQTCEAMVEARKAANTIESEREKAIAYHDTVVPMLESIRYHIDKLELVVDDRMWTLPKYRELLFIR